MYALIQKSDNTILRVAPEGPQLAEEKPFYWLECPDDCKPNWTFDGDAFNPPVVPVIPLADLKASLIAAIDDRVAAIYSRWTRFQAEYELRESEALAFEAGGYVGEVPRQVAAFADRAGLAYQQATDLILGQAALLRTALANLGDLRMRKYEVAAAADVEAAQAAYDTIAALVDAEGAAIQ
jgi:hypothetical protein